MNDRLPFPEVMQFVVDKGPMGTALPLPSPLSSFKRWTHNSPELKGHKHRWLALNEKLKGADLKEGFLFFNELVELDRNDTRKEAFTITLADDGTTHRFLNRQVFCCHVDASAAGICSHPSRQQNNGDLDNAA